MDYEFPLDKFLPRPSKIIGRDIERAESARSYEDPSVNLQIIERTANLLKEVEHHWKKSLFVDPFLSSKSISDIGDSDSDNYVEKLASIRFNKSVHHVIPSQSVRGRQKPLSSFVYRNERPVLQRPDDSLSGFLTEGHAREELRRRKIQRGSVARGGVSLVRGGSFLSRGGAPVTRARGAFPRPGTPVARGGVHSICKCAAEPKKSASAGSLQEIEKAVPKGRPASRQPSPLLHIAEAATNTDPLPRNNAFLDVRWTSSAPAEIPRMAVQALPSVDIRPDLRVQTGPAISIGAATSVPSRLSPANVAVFSCVHPDNLRPTPEHYSRPFLYGEPFSASLQLDDANAAGNEEVLAAELELRSLAENVLYRVRAGRCGQQLTNSLFTLVDLLSRSVDKRTQALSGPASRDLPGRMEAVSDLLSDELKTWGEQSDQHYRRVDNILKHLILDIRLSQGNEDLLTVHKELGISNGLNQGNTVKGFCKELTSEPSPRLKSTSSNRMALKSSIKLSATRKPVSFSQQNTPRQGISLEQKLIHEKCRKVQHLEKVYSINHELEMLQKMDEEVLKDAAESVRVEKTKSSRSSSRQSLSVTLSQESVSYNPADIPPPTGSSDHSSAVSDKSVPNSTSQSPITNQSSHHNEDRSNSKEQPTDGASDNGSIVEEIAGDSAPDGDDSSLDNCSSSTSTETHHTLNETYIINGRENEEELNDMASHSKSIILSKDSVHSDYDEDFELDESEKQPSIPEDRIDEDSEEAGTSEYVIPTITSSSKIIKEPSGDKKIKREKLSINRSSSFLKKSDIDDSVPDKNKLWKGCKFPIKSIMMADKPIQCGISPDDSPPRILTVSNPKNVTLLEVKLPKSSTKFLKVYSKNETGEIKVSYVNQSNPQGEQDISSSESNSSKSVPKIQSNLKLKQAEENERVIKETMNSSLLKSMLEEQIAKVVAKFNEVNQMVLPNVSVAGCQCGSRQINKKIDYETTDIPSGSDKNSSKCFEVGGGDVPLRSPKVHLRLDGNLLDGTESIGEKINDFKPSDQKDNYLHLSGDIQKSASDCSEHVPQSVSSISKSLNQIKIDPPPLTLERDVTLYQFNSDEFIVYPRLHPLPSLVTPENSEDNCQKIMDSSSTNVEIVPLPDHSAPKSTLECADLPETPQEIYPTSKPNYFAQQEILEALQSNNISEHNSRASLNEIPEDSVPLDIQPEPYILPELSELILKPNAPITPEMPMLCKPEPVAKPRKVTSEMLNLNVHPESNLIITNEIETRKESCCSFTSKSSTHGKGDSGEGPSYEGSRPSGRTRESLTDAVESLPKKFKRKTYQGKSVLKVLSKRAPLKRKVTKAVWSGSREGEDDDSTTSTWTSTGSTTSEVFTENTCYEVELSPPTAVINALGTARLVSSDPILFSHSSSSDSSIDEWQFSALSDDILNDIPHLNEYLNSLSGTSRIRRCSRHKRSDLSYSKRLT